jgi:hypothetical protein
VEKSSRCSAASATPRGSVEPLGRARVSCVAGKCRSGHSGKPFLAPAQ